MGNEKMKLSSKKKSLFSGQYVSYAVKFTSSGSSSICPQSGLIVADNKVLLELEIVQKGQSISIVQKQTDKLAKSQDKLADSTKKSTKRHVERKRAREISLKPKKVSEKDIKKIEEKIQKIKNTKSKDIRDALEKKGIRVSGKSDRLLKDIYFYSEVGNMNIRHE